MGPIRCLSGRWVVIALAFSIGACGGSGANETGGAGSGGGAGTGGTTATAGTGGDGSGGTAAAAGGGGGGSAAAERWIVDSTASIHGQTPAVLGSPQAMSSPYGDALCFDGDDAVVLDANPVQGMAAFTVEALVRIDGVTTAALNQPRYLHIETTEPSRLTLEARVTETDWHLDTFLLSGTQSRTLIDAAKVHPAGQWAWTALSYENGQMRHFVDGVEDASGTVTVPAFGPGKMSLGVRQNLQYWFKGCIREVRVTPAALSSDALQRP
jgi:hypothetical protein